MTALDRDDLARRAHETVRVLEQISGQAGTGAHFL
ncbi:hypothetical protein DEDE109153_13680 [Deinococcus deserti]